MNIFNNNNFVILDGGIGRMLQQCDIEITGRPEEIAITNPDVLTHVHKKFVQAGSDIICSNTFGANPYKLSGCPYTLEEVANAAVKCAKNAAQSNNDKQVLVAFDVGPLGEMLEPLGLLTFEEAYNAYAKVMAAGEKAGADLIMIETMTDLYETKAAVLAALEHTQLPVIASMTFEADGRTFSGVSIEAMAATLSNLSFYSKEHNTNRSVSALGINCSLGPAEIVSMATTLCKYSSVPVYIKPNAGLPNPTTNLYSVGAEEFAQLMLPCLENGVSAVGGCCGTTPETIKLLADIFAGKKPAQRKALNNSVVCGATSFLEINGVTPIGERINPTGKKRLQQALAEEDMGYLQTQAVLQEKDGAKILDVNVGAPGVDEIALLPKAVKAVQAVCGLPLQLDSANPAALEAALRVYNGKAIINSTTGEQEKMDAILPICKKYGAAVVGLTLDESGIPPTAQGRFEIAQRILGNALKHGIAKEDVYIDCLTLTVSADEAAPAVTLQATNLVKSKLGLKTVLGVSNVSFGLPARPAVNTAFLTLAMQSGLDLPILNPATQSMMAAVHAFKLLTGQDHNAMQYVEIYGGQQTATPAALNAATGSMGLAEAIEKGLKDNAALEAKKMLENNSGNTLKLVDNYLVPALDKVGTEYEAGRIFLPQLLAAAGAAQATFEVIRNSMGASVHKGPPVVVATVKGDVHDIGKNIAKTLLENYGFDVTDLGRDVPPEKVVEAVKKTGANLAGLSALMTTTLPSVTATLELLRKEAPSCKVLVAGAVITPEYAKSIGADFYAKDAPDTVSAAKKVYGL